MMQMNESEQFIVTTANVLNWMIIIDLSIF